MEKWWPTTSPPSLEDPPKQPEPADENRDSLKSDDFVMVRTKSDSVHRGDVRGDELNIAVLLFLYVLQGIPLGLAAAVPLILTNRHVSYKQQAEFRYEELTVYTTHVVHICTYVTQTRCHPFTEG